MSLDPLVLSRLAIAGWSSQAARRAHNPKVVGANPTPATNNGMTTTPLLRGLFVKGPAMDGCARSGRQVIMLGNVTALRELLEPVIDAMGYELVMVELTGAGSKTLRVYIDSPGGIVLDDCETVSRQVSALLDVDDPISGEYALEISSPGLDRPLAKPEHFRRAEGNMVKIKMIRSHLGRRNFTGLLKCVSGEGAVVEVDGEEYELAYNDMDRARLVSEFENKISRSRG